MQRNAMQYFIDNSPWGFFSDNFSITVNEINNNLSLLFTTTKDYLPTKVDGVYASERPGIVKYEFIQESCTFNIIDVDDQRCYNSNYKWYKFPCFQNISSIVFCVSPNGYDEVVTNSATNGLEDSLTLFDRIVNHRFFSNASVILLFNDTDLLMEKIQHSNIKQYFPDFQGDPQKPEDVRCYIFELFDRQLRERSDILYHHFTTANDIENFRFVFASVKDTVLQNCFKSLNKD